MFSMQWSYFQNTNVGGLNWIQFSLPNHNIMEIFPHSSPLPHLHAAIIIREKSCH